MAENFEDDDDINDGTPLSRIVVAQLALERVIPKGLIGDIAAGRVRGVLLTVPSATWVSAITVAAQAVFPEDSSFISVTARSRSGDQGQVSPSARFVVAISQSPDLLLPRATLMACDVELRIEQPDGHLIRKAAKRLLRGRIGAEFAGVPVSGLDLDEIAACLPRDGTAALAKRRFENAARKKTSTARTGDVPTLAEAAGYGQAHLWALDLQRDLDDLRAGLISAEDCDRGAILVGKPGTGKSLFARILAKSCGLPIVATTMGELFTNGTGYLDSVMKSLRQAFDQARERAPSLLFIDEIDSFPSRESLSERNRDYWTPLVNDFLVLLDSATSSSEGVVVLGATNNAGSIDPALIRPGRLERILYIDPPDAVSLAKIMRYYLRDDLPDTDLVALASARQGATGAEVQEWVRAARRSARRAGRTMVFEDLVTQVVAPDRRSADDVERAAIHEAGHAVATVVLSPNTLVSVTIVRTHASSGNTSALRFGKDLMVERDLDNLACRLLAGRAAEEVLLGDVSTGSGGDVASDLAQVTNLVCMKHLSLGMADELLWRSSPTDVHAALALDPNLRAKVSADMSQLYLKTKSLISTYRAHVSAVAETLKAMRTLSGAEVASIVCRPVGAPADTELYRTEPDHADGVRQ